MKSHAHTHTLNPGRARPSREGELALASRIGAGAAAAATLEARPRPHRRDRPALAEAVRDGEAAVAELASSALPWARKFSMKYATLYRVDPDDAFGLAQIGLVKAARGFDPARGFRFTTMVTACVQHELRRGVTTLRTGVAIPVNGLLRKWREDAPEERRALMAAALNVATLHEYRQGGEAVAPDAVAEHELAESRLAARRAVRAAIEEADLDDRQRRIIQGRFYEEKTLESLSHEFSISRERVRQVEAEALARIGRRLDPAAVADLMDS